ncbi:MAG: hypothetical protein IKN53_01500 [Oscillibacter sp.]|nr:hypothetical protein [Oscillibacter sp.]
MKAFTRRKLAELLGSLMILVPCVLLMAWEENIPNVAVFWVILLVASGMFAAAMVSEEMRLYGTPLKRALMKCGGFLVMFGFILYKVGTLIFG